MSKLIAIVGAPCSGKTTLSRDLVHHFDQSSDCPEYARNYIEEFEVHPVSIYEELNMYVRMKEAEDIKRNIYKTVFCDSAIFLTYLYSLHLCDFSSKKETEILSFLYRRGVEALHDRYDEIFYVKPISYGFDGLRKGGEYFQEIMDEKILGFLKYHNKSFHTIEGDAKQRVEQVKSVLNLSEA